MKRILLSGVLVLCSVNTVLASGKHDAPTDHAPIGVMGDHIHEQGEWMLSYRYGHMEMDGNRDGTDDVSTAQVLDEFMVAPLDMQMDMHMFGMMYGATDQLTLMAMAPYIEKTMNHITRMGTRFETRTDGIGDVKLSGIYQLYESGDMAESSDASYQRVLLNGGLSLPTGSIDERGDTPAGQDQFLPYPMQLGSGTYDPFFAATWVRQQQHWAWGAQGKAVIRAGTNDEGYRLGNEYEATAWAARDVSDYLSLSLRLHGQVWEDIDGANDVLNPMMVPTARTDLRGGERVDALIGANLYAPHGHLKGHRLAFEFGLPVYQRLDGPQLETDYRLTIGWQKAF